MSTQPIVRAEAPLGTEPGEIRDFTDEQLRWWTASEPSGQLGRGALLLANRIDEVLQPVVHMLENPSGIVRVVADAISGIRGRLGI